MLAARGRGVGECGADMIERAEHGATLRRSRLPRAAQWGYKHNPTKDRKSTRLNSSHGYISYAVFCLKKKNPDEEWQAKCNEKNASFLPKGQAGNWQRLFNGRHQAIFKEVVGEMLIKCNHEKDVHWQS